MYQILNNNRLSVGEELIGPDLVCQKAYPASRKLVLFVYSFVFDIIFPCIFICIYYLLYFHFFYFFEKFCKRQKRTAGNSAAESLTNGRWPTMESVARLHCVTLPCGGNYPLEQQSIANNRQQQTNTQTNKQIKSTPKKQQRSQWPA